MEIRIYTDGACCGQKVGGWSYILICKVEGKEDIIRAYRNAAPEMTNQRAELMAVIAALANLTKPAQVTILSDAAYVVNCFQQGWYLNWEANGWKNSKGEDVANQDLWKRLLPLYAKHTVEFEKVKGHSGDFWNERADVYAKMAVRDYKSQMELDALGHGMRYKGNDGQYLGEAFDPSKDLL